MAQEITREGVAEATLRFLEAGGIIERLPDTVAEQRAWLHLVSKLDTLERLDERN